MHIKLGIGENVVYASTGASESTKRESQHSFPCLGKSQQVLQQQSSPSCSLQPWNSGRTSMSSEPRDKSRHEPSPTASLPTRNGSSVRRACFQVSFILKYLIMCNRKKLLFAALVDRLPPESGILLQKRAPKARRTATGCRLANASSSTCDPAAGMVSIWTDFYMKRPLNL